MVNNQLLNETLILFLADIKILNSQRIFFKIENKS